MDSTYTGPERRSAPWATVEEWQDVKEKVEETHTKVFNGLSNIPTIVMWGFGIIIFLLVTVVGIAGSVKIQTAVIEQRLSDHLNGGTHVEAQQ